MNKLRNMRCYLAGAMEKEPDLGQGWREKIKKDLRSLGIIWFDPLDKPYDVGQEDEVSYKQRDRDRSIGNLFSVKISMEPVCSADIRMVTVSDFMIVKLNPKVPTFGTHDEISVANSQNKPILIWIEGGLRCIPFWLIGKLPVWSFFGSKKTLVQYLRYIDECGIHDQEGRWMFYV
jgi:hypothetical protein